MTTTPPVWRETTVRRVLRPLERPAQSGLGVITAYRDGAVTLRSNRREDGYTFSDSENGYQEIHPGDLVFHALDGFAGAVGISDSHGNGSPVYHVCEPVAGDDPAFLARLLRHLGTSGFLATQAPNVRERSVDFRNWSTFARIPLALPSADAQRAVAGYLDRETTRIDTLLEEQQRLIEMLRERRRSVIVRAITQGLDPAAKLEESGTDWIGRMPSSWRVKRFAHIVATSNAGEVIDRGWWGDGSELLFTCARDAILSNFEAFPEDKRTRSQDILITRNATPYIHMPPPGSIYSNVVQRVTLVPTVNKNWAKYALEAASAAMHGTGVSIDTFNFGMWRALRLPMPTMAEQVEIVAFLDEQIAKIDTLITETQRFIELSKERRAALITAAVTGQIDVRKVV